MSRKKNKMEETDIHHLNPYGSWTNHPNNLVELSRRQHEAYHDLFGIKWIIEALKQLFGMWEKSIADGKAKKDLIKCLEDLDYKDECKCRWKPKKR